MAQSVKRLTLDFSSCYDIRVLRGPLRQALCSLGSLLVQLPLVPPPAHVLSTK